LKEDKEWREGGREREKQERTGNDKRRADPQDTPRNLHPHDDGVLGVDNVLRQNLDHHGKDGSSHGLRGGRGGVREGLTFSFFSSWRVLM